MLTLARALQALDDVWNHKPSEMALTWNTRVQFDHELIPHLVADYTALNQRFDALATRIETEKAAAAELVAACAEELHRLRHTEALRLYPVIARALSADPVARRLFWQSRLVMLGIARRIFRRLDELARALRNDAGIPIAVEHAAKAFVEYRQRNETEIYPLYRLAKSRDAGATHAA